MLKRLYLFFEYYFNFTFVLIGTQLEFTNLVFQSGTLEEDDTQEAEQDRLLYQKLMARVNWVFTSLFCFDFIHDPVSHRCFRLPPEAEWTFLVEVCSSSSRAHVVFKETGSMVQITLAWISFCVLKK